MNTEIQSITTLVEHHLGQGNWRVLEAGCGSISHIPIPDSAIVVGIDISSRQLQRNTRLNESILGDIQSLSLPREDFDLIVCWDVLEHLPAPEKALRNLFEAVRPGGVVLLAFPNLYSLKGLVTRLTPFIFHLWFYRYLIGDRREREEMDQFPTYLKLAATPSRVIRQAQKQGLEIGYSLTYEGPVQRYLRSRNKFADFAFWGFEGVCKVLSMGWWNPSLSDCIMVLVKPKPSRDS